MAAVNLVGKPWIREAHLGGDIASFLRRQEGVPPLPRAEIERLLHRKHDLPAAEAELLGLEYAHNGVSVRRIGFVLLFHDGAEAHLPADDLLGLEADAELEEGRRHQADFLRARGPHRALD